jgi:hypothetical protein
MMDGAWEMLREVLENFSFVIFEFHVLTKNLPALRSGRFWRKGGEEGGREGRAAAGGGGRGQEATRGEGN